PPTPQKSQSPPRPKSPKSPKSPPALSPPQKNHSPRPPRDALREMPARASQFITGDIEPKGEMPPDSKSPKNVSERHTKSNYPSRPKSPTRLTRQTRPTPFISAKIATLATPPRRAAPWSTRPAA
ncbi:MAG: hypothetical protein K2J12_04765, partial [Muribaculaceae bacterium]|nr:hypothetical protein [Muribaculaceae bacterium]